MKKSFEQSFEKKSIYSSKCPLKIKCGVACDKKEGKVTELF